MHSEPSHPFRTCSPPYPHRALQDGITPLSIAVQNNHLEVVRLLLGHGANKQATLKVGAERLPLGLLGDCLHPAHMEPPIKRYLCHGVDWRMN